MTMKVGPETSARASTWFVRPKDMREKSWSPGFPYSLYMAFTAYIYDEKSLCRDFPYSFYMACTAYIYDEKSWYLDFP
jgi:hypothetical protein